MTTEQFFKDKIDWKLYNMLKDIITRFEDTGIEISLSVCVDSMIDGMGPNQNNFFPIHFYSSENGDRCTTYKSDMSKVKQSRYEFNVEIRKIENYNEIANNIKDNILSSGKFLFKEKNETFGWVAMSFEPKK